MAMYYCHHCDTMLDNDWHPGEEDPENELQLICPDCLLDYQHWAEKEGQPSEAQEWYDYDPDC